MLQLFLELARWGVLANVVMMRNTERRGMDGGSGSVRHVTRPHWVPASESVCGPPSVPRLSARVPNTLALMGFVARVKTCGG